MVNQIDNFLSIIVKKIIYFVFFIALIFNFYYIFAGFNNDLLNMYSFRQTQVAISIFYYLKEGFKLNYITPVLGSPWSIPMEFPTYQLIVGFFSKITQLPVDQSGRIVSIAFFYASLLIIYKLGQIIFKKKESIFIFLTLILFNPMYIFWSRSVMIESTALYFSLLFLFKIVKTYQKNQFSLANLLVIIVSGSLAGLTKITTYSIYCFVSGSYILYYYFYTKNFKKLITDCRFLMLNIFRIFLIFFIPFSITILWTRHADYIKSLNPLAKDFITSQNLFTWNFGTLEQKIDKDTWLQISKFTIFNLFNGFNTLSIKLFLLGLSVITLFRKKLGIRLLFVLLCFLVGPLVFTNLYYVHHYYYYANLVFIIGTFAYLIIYLYENEKTKFFGSILPMILMIMISISFIHQYQINFLPIQLSNDSKTKEVADYININSKNDDVILIYGFDWDPTIPYYSKRKAIMDRDTNELSSPKIQDSIEKIGFNKIKLILVAPNYATDDDFENIIVKNLNYFKLKDNPIEINNIKIFQVQD